MQPIKLIVTDLDGTLVGDDVDVGAYARFTELLDAYRERYGTRWAVCSGRSHQSLEHAMEPLRRLHLNPDYAVVRSSLLYRNGKGRFRPQFTWNWGVRIHKLMSFFYLRGALRDWNRDMIQLFTGCTTLYKKSNILGLRFRNRSDADAAANLLTHKAQVFRHLRVYQHLTEVEVRCVSYTKGMAVEQLASRLGIKPSEILCIGNGTTDISMLDGLVASHSGCPVNAELDVMDAVHRAHGYIATKKSIAGVVEILDGYLRGEVRNTLPDWWTYHRNPKSHNASRMRSHHHHHHRMGQRSERRVLALALLILYAVIVVFASFELLPFSRWIMLPFTWVAGGVERIMTWMLL